MPRLIPPLSPSQKASFVVSVRSLLASRKDKDGKPEAARWKHVGRSKKAVDCIGTAIYAYRQIGLGGFVQDLSHYSRSPDGKTLREHLVGHLGDPLEIAQAEPGDIALMRWYGNKRQQWFNHVGVITDYVHGGLALLHSSEPHKKVIEHRIDEVWRRRIVEVYRT